MIQKIHDEFFASVLSRPYPGAEQVPETSVQKLKSHGTTTGVFLIEDGNAAIAFSDGKVSRGMKDIMATDLCKMFQVDRYSCLLVAGALGAAIDMVRKLETMIGFSQDANNVLLPAEVKVNYAEQLQRMNMPLAGQGFEVELLFTTFDSVGTKKVRIFQVAMDGTQLEMPALSTSGSGGPTAETLIDNGWKPDMNQEEGVNLVRKVSEKAPKKDSFTGGVWTLWRLDASGVGPLERWSA